MRSSNSARPNASGLRPSSACPPPGGGIPSHDTTSGGGRLFATLDPGQLERRFLNWTARLAKTTGGKLVAIDGKTLRCSFDRASDKAAIHMVSAFCQSNHMVLGQLTVDAKSNEITALPRLLKLLDLTDATVTVDAMHCQKKTAKAIREAGGHYVMQVKANQKSLHEDVKLSFDEAIEHGWPPESTPATPITRRSRRATLPGGRGLILHSDRGVQFASDEFRAPANAWASSSR